MNFIENSQKSQLISIEPYPQDFLKDFANVSKDFVEFSLLTQKVESVDLSVLNPCKPMIFCSLIPVMCLSLAVMWSLNFFKFIPVYKQEY